MHVIANQGNNRPVPIHNFVKPSQMREMGPPHTLCKQPVNVPIAPRGHTWMGEPPYQRLPLQDSVSHPLHSHKQFQTQLHTPPYTIRPAEYIAGAPGGGYNRDLEQYQIHEQNIDRFIRELKKFDPERGMYYQFIRNDSQMHMRVLQFLARGEHHKKGMPDNVLAHANDMTLEEFIHTEWNDIVTKTSIPIKQKALLYHRLHILLGISDSQPLLIAGYIDRLKAAVDKLCEQIWQLAETRGPMDKYTQAVNIAIDRIRLGRAGRNAQGPRMNTIFNNTECGHISLEQPCVQANVVSESLEQDVGLHIQEPPNAVHRVENFGPQPVPEAPAEHVTVIHTEPAPVKVVEVHTEPATQDVHVITHDAVSKPKAVHVSVHPTSHPVPVTEVDQTQSNEANATVRTTHESSEVLGWN